MHFELSHCSPCYSSACPSPGTTKWNNGRGGGCWTSMVAIFSISVTTNFTRTIFLNNTIVESPQWERIIIIKKNFHFGLPKVQFSKSERESEGSLKFTSMNSKPQNDHSLAEGEPWCGTCVRVYGDETFQWGWRGCLNACGLRSLRLGRSGLPTLRNATGTHSSAAPAFLQQSLPAAPRLIRGCDCFSVRLRLTTQQGS